MTQQAKKVTRLLRVPQAVEYLGGAITAKCIRDWIWRGKLRTVRLGRAVCIPVEELDKLVERGTRPARGEL